MMLAPILFFTSPLVILAIAFIAHAMECLMFNKKGLS